jgi:hypothetical protein
MSESVISGFSQMVADANTSSRDRKQKHESGAAPLPPPATTPDSDKARASVDQPTPNTADRPGDDMVSGSLRRASPPSECATPL